MKLYSLQVLLLGVQNCLKDLSVSAKGKYVDHNLIGFRLFWVFKGAWSSFVAINRVYTVNIVRFVTSKDINKLFK